MRTTEAVVGKWPGVLVALGVEEKYLTGKHCPCPVCGGKDRFRFADDGKGFYFCNQCGNGDGFSLLQKVNGWDFKESARRIDAIVGNVESRPVRRNDPLPRLKRIARELIPASQCDSVVRYLNSRGLKDIPKALKAHPRLAYFHEGKKVGEYPAMVARIVDPENKPLTFHCTYTLNGSKLDKLDPRKIMPPVRSTNCGSAVRLYPAGETLGIAEGIETAMAAHQRFGIPVWAAIHANGIKGFEPPEGCLNVVIFADNDFSFTGQAAAYELARRLHGKFGVDIKIAPDVGTDWADHV